MAKQNFIRLSGKIHFIGEVEKFASGFTKREMWLCIESGKYPNIVPFTFKKDKMGELNGWKVGDVVSVGGFLSGRTWEGKDGKPPRCFLGLDGWKVEAYHEGAEGAGAQVVTEDEADAACDVMQDDMPF